MKLTALRIALAPVTSWRAYRLRRAHRGTLTYDTAWRRTRILDRPDESPYLLYGHEPNEAQSSSRAAEEVPRED